MSLGEGVRSVVWVILRVPGWRAGSGGQAHSGRGVDGDESFELVPNCEKVRLGIRMVGVQEVFDELG